MSLDALVAVLIACAAAVIIVLTVIVCAVLIASGWKEVAGPGRRSARRAARAARADRLPPRDDFLNN